MVRPEQLECPRERSRGVPPGSAPRRARRNVEQCRYYGHDALLHIRPADSGGVAELLLARVHGEQALPVGTPVTVAAHGSVTPLF